MVQHRQSAWPPRPLALAVSASDAGELPSSSAPSSPTTSSSVTRWCAVSDPSKDADSSPAEDDWIVPPGLPVDDLDDESAPDTIPTPPPDLE